MSNTLPPPEVRFAANCENLAAAIKDGIINIQQAGFSVNVNPSMIDLATSLLQAYDKKLLIEGFIKNSHQECWDQINQRNEIFFDKNAAKIFKILPMDTINLFRDLYFTKNARGESVVTSDIKDGVWSILDAMIKIAIKYTHAMRGPILQKNAAGDMVVVYTNKLPENLKFLEEVNIEKHSKTWKIQLDTPVKL
jgi:hypothetical protein